MRTVSASVRRLVWIVRALAAHAVAHVLGERLDRWPRFARHLPSGRLTRPERLSAVLQDLGGTFIKFGQMLALQPDILSLEYCNALFDLLDRVAPFSWEEAERVVREELGRGTEDLFDSVERVPLATASIGQVHVAWMEGRKVAVKVQRPAVETDFTGDIRLMVATMAFVRRFRLASLYWMLEPGGEFVAWTREELDYRNEARYLRQLRENACDNPAEHIPAVHLATRRLLVVDFLEGVTVLDYLRALGEGDEVKLQRLQSRGFDPATFARRMIDNFLGDAFRHGLFHADLHPANLMILPDNVVGYIDFGITGVLSHYSRYHLVMMTLSYTRADPDGMCAAFLKVSTTDARADLAAFRDGLRRFTDIWYERQGRQKKLRKNFTLVMLDMLKLSRATGIWPERDVIKYIRSAIAIDGLITRFAPGFSVGGYLEEVCDRYIRQEARRALFTRDRMIAWADASSRLATDGPFRLVDALAHLRSELPPPRAEAAPPEGGAPSGPRSLRFATVAFAASLLVTVTGERAALGWNLFTASAAVATAALLMLARTLFEPG